METHLERFDEGECDPQIRDLDPDLLSTAFGIQTNWHVITGCICCGKTTLIDMLADQGFKTVPEISRVYIEQEVAKGRTLEQIFSSEEDERAITALQQRMENGLAASDVLFLDRALPDFLWFWRLLEMDPNELLVECFHHRYASIFILDPLPLQLDGARIEDEDYTVRLQECLIHDYSALGYQLQRVPVMSPQERLTYVLERLTEQEFL